MADPSVAAGPAPHLLAERSLLGVAMLGDHAAVLAAVSAADLELQRHRLTLQAIEVAAESGAADPIAVAAQLERWGRLVEAGGHAALLDLVDAAAYAGAALIGEHAAMVRAAADRRRTVDVLRRAQLAAEDGATADELRDVLAQAIEGRRAAPPRRTRNWLDVADDPPIAWLVDGLLPAQGLVVLAGEPGSGKTLLALDVALRAAHGHDWLGRVVRPTSTLYLAGEGSLSVRCCAWRAAHPAARPIEGHTVEIVDGVPALTDPAGIAELSALLAAHERAHGRLPGMVVVDTLAMAAPGGDENDAAAMGLVLRVLLDVAARGVCVLLLHHLRKTQDGQRSGGQSAVRGSSAIVGAADVVLLAGRRDDAHAITCAKIRDGEAPEPIRYRVRGQDTGRVRDDGRAEYGPVVLPAGEAAPQSTVDPAQALEADVAAVVACIAQHGRTSPIDAIGPLAGIGRDRGRVAVRLAVSRGVLVPGGSTRDRWYDLPARANPPRESQPGDSVDPDSRGESVRVQTPHTPRPRGRANGAADHAEPIHADSGEPRESARIRANQVGSTEGAEAKTKGRTRAKGIKLAAVPEPKVTLHLELMRPGQKARGQARRKDDGTWTAEALAPLGAGGIGMVEVVVAKAEGLASRADCTAWLDAQPFVERPAKGLDR